MPLEFVQVHIVRPLSTVTATGGLSKPVETEIPGSPFLARVYRVPQTTVGRDEAQPGTATLDEMQRLSILDPACPVQANDIAFLPRADGSYARAKVVRPRFYTGRVQFDLETGAEGGAPPLMLAELSVDGVDAASADAVDAAPLVSAAPLADVIDRSSADVTG